MSGRRKLEEVPHEDLAADPSVPGERWNQIKVGHLAAAPGWRSHPRVQASMGNHRGPF